MAPAMQTGTRRLVITTVVVIVAVILGVIAGTFVFRQPRDRVEVLVQSVAMLLDDPEDGMTTLHAYLVVRNLRSSPIRIDTIVLVAYDPEEGTLFDTFTHEDVELGVSHSWAFSEVSVLSGLWSDVSFTVRIFPDGSPGWESPLTPDQPVTWYPGSLG